MTPVHELRRRGGQVASKQPVCNTRTGMPECEYSGMETRISSSFRSGAGGVRTRCGDKVVERSLMEQPACRARLNASRWLWTDLGECRCGRRPGNAELPLSLCQRNRERLEGHEERALEMREEASCGQVINHLLVVLRTWTWFIAPNSTGSFPKFLNKGIVRSDQF